MKVLLLGDSIRMFYQKEVISQLGEDYQVYGPDENCRFSLYMLNSIRFWMNQFPIPDIIHFNAGLWDTAILYKEDGCFVGIDDYVKNMKRIYRELKKTGAKIIFATTTPVSDDKISFCGPMPPAHDNEKIIQYNNAVLQAYKNEDIIINDLFSAMYPKRKTLLRDDMIHPNEEGAKLLGGLVANAIKSCGDYKNRNTATRVLVKDKQDEKTIQ